MLFPINRLDSTAKLSSVMSWTNVDLHQHPTHWLSFHRPELKRPCEPIQPWPISQLIQSDSPSKQQLIDRQWLIRNPWEKKKKKNIQAREKKKKKECTTAGTGGEMGLVLTDELRKYLNQCLQFFSIQTNASAAHMHYTPGQQMCQERLKKTLNKLLHLVDQTKCSWMDHRKEQFTVHT